MLLLREKKLQPTNLFIMTFFVLSLLPFLLLLLLLLFLFTVVGCNFVFIQRNAGTKYPPSTFIILFESSIILYNVRISVQQQCKISTYTYVRALGHTHSSFNMPLLLFFIWLARSLARSHILFTDFRFSRQTALSSWCRFGGIVPIFVC